MRFFRPVPRLTLAQAEDASAVAALLALAGVAGTAPAPDAGEVGAWLRGGFEVYKASLDGKLVGCIRCAFPTGACVIDQIAVVPAERGRGFGEYLLEQAISRARRAGAARAWIHLPEACEAPIKLARKLGFREAARHQLAASGEPVVLLEMVL
jgi:ribosomal protein S18 acetylase RimI-like enzyme